jgi:hypothetical protein
MGDYIYILLGIAWVAYSIYSARQKALQKQQTSGLPPSGPSQSSPLPIPGGEGRSILEDLFRGLTSETLPANQETKPVPPQKAVRNKDVSELNQTYQGFSGYKFVTDAEPVPVTKQPEDINLTHPIHEKMTKSEDLKRNFNLRDAVIYSELLTRKYF